MVLVFVHVWNVKLLLCQCVDFTVGLKGKEVSDIQPAKRRLG